MPIVSLPNVQTYYEVHGRGVPVVLLNGLGLDIAAWTPQIQGLCPAYQVVAFDARGMGRSSAPPPPYSVADLAADALALLDDLEIERAHFLGLSLGGLVAQHLAIHSERRVKSVVLAATAARLPARTRHVIDLWGRLTTSGVALESRLREQLAWTFSERFFDDESRAADVIAMLLSHPYPPSPQGFAGQVAAGVSHDARGQVSRIRVPTLVVAGEQDMLVAPASSRELAARIPRARLVTLDGVGHACSLEAADAFNRAVLDFLASVDRAPA